MKRAKPTKNQQPRERKLLIWPPEEWPEEARQAELAAFGAYMDEWWKFVLADMPPSTPTAEIIPFPGNATLHKQPKARKP